MGPQGHHSLPGNQPTATGPRAGAPDGVIRYLLLVITNKLIITVFTLKNFKQLKA